MVLLCRFVATGEKSADMVTDEGDIMVLLTRDITGKLLFKKHFQLL